MEKYPLYISRTKSSENVSLSTFVSNIPEPRFPGSSPKLPFHIHAQLQTLEVIPAPRRNPQPNSKNRIRASHRVAFQNLIKSRKILKILRRISCLLGCPLFELLSFSSHHEKNNQQHTYIHSPTPGTREMELSRAQLFSISRATTPAQFIPASMALGAYIFSTRVAIALVDVSSGVYQ